MRSGRGGTRGPGLPLYRSRRAAARNGLRVFVSVVLSSALFSLTGWPLASQSLLIIGALAGLSATNPNPSAFAKGAVVAVPLAAALAGFTEFVVLDGADEFALLAIAMAPIVVGASLLVAGGNPKLFGVGFLILVFFPALLAPSNPQDYNPASFLYSSLLFTVGAVVLTVALATLFPTTDAHRRGWIMRSARIEARGTFAGGLARSRSPEATFRDADRIVQLTGLKDGTPASRDADLRGALLFADLGSAARRALEASENGDLGEDATVETRRALMSLHPERLHGMAERLLALEQPGDPRSPVEGRRVAVELIWIAALIDMDPDGIERFRRDPA